MSVPCVFLPLVMSVPCTFLSLVMSVPCTFLSGSVCPHYIPLPCNVCPLYIPLFTGWISVLVSTDWHTDGQTKWYLDFWSCFFVAKKSLARVYAWPEFGTCFLIVFSVWCWYLPRRWFDLETGDKTRPVNDNSGILGDTCDICPLIHDRAWQYDNTRVTGEH